MTIDLRSDTVTRPTAAMRRAMAEAEVGDDVLDGDPTVRRLEARVAELLGKERALFFPTGSMANQTAIMLHAPPGTEALCDANAHVIHWEMGAMAALGGVQPRPIAPSGFVMSAADLRAGARTPSRVAPAARLVCLENTHNGAGGKVTGESELAALRAVADELGLPVHLDGARLWNASAATGTSLARLAACADTVMVSFSKGLGAPVGAVLAGPAPLLERAWTVRKRLGGGMRQSGILAAAALHGLDHHLARLPEDHANAKRIAGHVAGAGGATVVPPDTNIIMVDLPSGVTAAALIARCAASGVLVSGWTTSRVRLVTHLDVTTDQADEAARVVAEAIEALGDARRGCIPSTRD
ncbi:MAG TPA: GntG family PLP-dependent aldolase [Gemmatimonadaceae bacterium]|nr:GntG family PLP-dependent aldolase [Gemmatimonadaceae bacterium]